MRAVQRTEAFSDKLLDYLVARVVDGKETVPEGIRLALCDRLLLRDVERSEAWGRWRRFAESIPRNPEVGSFRELLDEEYKLR